MDENVRLAVIRSEEPRRQSRQALDLERFYRQNKEIVRRGIALILAFLLSNVVTGCCVKAKAEKKLRAEYSVQLQQEISLARQEITTEVRSIYGADAMDEQTAQFEAEVQLVTKLVYPYLVNVTDNSIRSIVWCVLCRVLSNGYPDTIEDVVRQRDQWMSFSDDNPRVQRAEDIVREMLELFYSGKPRPMDPVFVFMNWEHGEITLRDSFNGKYHIWDDTDWEKLGYK